MIFIVVFVFAASQTVFKEMKSYSYLKILLFICVSADNLND
jgi:hypothetical protein